MLIDMGSKVQFKIYHNEKTLEYGPNDIILWGFRCIKNNIDKARRADFSTRLTMDETCFPDHFRDHNINGTWVFDVSYCLYQTLMSERYTLIKG
jgi:hypothetical protein